jgi:hypothetical protein
LQSLVYQGQHGNGGDLHLDRSILVDLVHGLADADLVFGSLLSSRVEGRHGVLDRFAKLSKNGMGCV